MLQHYSLSEANAPGSYLPHFPKGEPPPGRLPRVKEECYRCDMLREVPRTTLEQRLAGNREANGFNRLRLIAALLVLFSHAFPITGAEEPLRLLGVDSSIGLLSVAAFFVISGLLVSFSYERSDLLRFVEKRILRILPALIVSVAICVFITSSSNRLGHISPEFCLSR
jgi:hypothetical protein